jgi:hypothetical protein
VPPSVPILAVEPPSKVPAVASAIPVKPSTLRRRSTALSAPRPKPITSVT